MSAVSRLRSWLRDTLRRSQVERGMDDELAFHIESYAADLERGGVPPAEARRRARAEFGGVEARKEECRDALGLRLLDDLRGDGRYAFRQLRRAPVFTVVAIVSLGLGIGANTAVFSLIDAVWLKTLPFREPARLVVIGEANPKLGIARGDVAPVNYALLASHNEAFDSIAAVAGYGATFHGDRPEKIDGRRVTGNFFDVMGVAPALGRVFRPEDDVPGAQPVAILSHGAWRDRFASDRAAVGRDILLDGRPVRVIGVMPAGFQFLGRDVSVWIPAAFSPAQLASGANYLTIVARLGPEVSRDQAQANLERLAARLGPGLPAAADGFRMHVASLHDYVAGDSRRPLAVLLAAVGVVMLIACANVASLLLARATARQHEIALRRSLGAARSRIVRQLLTESVVLGAGGLVAGVLVAKWALVFLEQLVPPAMLLFARPTLDVAALGFSAAVAMIAAVLFGLAPALHVTKPDLGSALKTGGRGVSGSNRGRSALVVAEVAMTLVLLVVAGLLIQTLYRLRYADVGFLPDRVISLRTALPSERYATHARRTAFYDEVLARVTRIPGVLAAGYTTSVPLAWKGASTGFVIEGRARDPQVAYDVNHRQVSADYLTTIGVPLREGRYFTASDDANAPPVVILNQTMARQYWPDGNAIGQRIKTTDDRPDAVPWLTIVGVVGDVRQMGLDAPVRAEMYVPYRQFATQPWFTPRDLVVRAAGDPALLAGAIRQEVHAVDAALAVSHTRLLTDILDEEVAARRVGTTLLVAFAAFAVLLALVGIYGVISGFVVQHTPEIGVRLALGAQARDILALVAGKGLVLTLAGIAIGAVAALGAIRFVSSLLYGVTAFDPTALLLASLVLMLLAAITTYVPARRATKLDAVVALRQK